MWNLAKQNQENRWLDPMFEDFFSIPSVFSKRDISFSPRVDIYDAEDHLTLRFEVPGMERDQIAVRVKDNTLIISGNRESKMEDSGECLVRQEIATGSFERQFTLPKSVRTDSIKAEYTNGILEVRLGKREESRTREISIDVK